MKSNSNDAFLKQFGINIRRIRLENLMSQEDLAFEIDSTQSHIGRIETGKVNTSISNARAIAQALKIPVSKLFDE